MSALIGPAETRWVSLNHDFRRETTIETASSCRSADGIRMDTPLMQAPVYRPRPRFISTTQLVPDALRLLSQLPPERSAVMGIALSGILPASTLATALHVPLYRLNQDRPSADGGDLVGRLSDAS